MALKLYYISDLEKKDMAGYLVSKYLILLMLMSTSLIRLTSAEDSTADERSMPELSTMEKIMIVFVSMVAVVIIYKFYKKCPCF